MINLGLLCGSTYGAYLVQMLRDVTADVGSVAYIALAVERLWAGTYQGED